MTFENIMITAWIIFGILCIPVIIMIYRSKRKYKPTNKYKKGDIVLGSDGKKYRCIEVFNNDKI